MQSKYKKPRIFQENPQRFQIEEGTLMYTGDFNAYFLRNLSVASVEFLEKYNGLELKKVNEQGTVIQAIKITIAEDINLDVVAAYLGTERDTLIWRDKIHWKSQDDDQKVYHDDWKFSFYDKPIDEKPIIRPAKFKFDFKDRLDPSNLRLLFDILVVDVIGYKKEM